MSSIAASGDTAPSVDGDSASPMLTRVYSALVMAPIAFACLWFGTPWFEILVAAATLTMAWEWRRICAAGAFGVPGAVLLLAVAAAIVLTAAGRTSAALAAVAAGAALAWVLARDEDSARWTALGPIAVGLPAIALVWLRGSDGGLHLVLWLVVAIWVTDIAAFFVGRAVGGPKLAPHISPKKTWAGLLGGVAGSALWTVGFGFWAGWSDSGASIAVGAAVAVLAQAGDLSISVVKRHFGVKDASNVIPGHGGMLDRTDGFVLAAPALALIVTFARSGAMPWA